MIFHLAIPSRSLIESTKFYVELGAKVGRTTEKAAVMLLHGHQIVLHKTEYIDQNPQMYPRHFGFIMDKRELVENLFVKYAKTKHIFRPLFVRNEGKTSEHHTFFLKDPSNNLIEFKWYKHKEGII